MVVKSISVGSVSGVMNLAGLVHAVYFKSVMLVLRNFLQVNFHEVKLVLQVPRILGRSVFTQCNKFCSQCGRCLYLGRSTYTFVLVSGIGVYY